MKTDTIFYDLFQQFPSFFFELLNRPPQEADQYEFSAVEVKQLAFRIDGVFLPNPEATEQPIYFVEVQFQADEELYARFFSEIFLYLRRSPLPNDWRGVLLYPRRSADTGETTRYQEFFDSGRVTRLYLNELTESSSIGLATFQLIIANQREAIERGQELIAQIQAQVDDQQQQQKLLQLLETILIYKLPEANQEEIEAMFTWSDLRETRVYREAVEEGRELGKLESVPQLLALGLSVEEIAQALNLTVEKVREASQQADNS